MRTVLAVLVVLVVMTFSIQLTPNSPRPGATRINTNSLPVLIPDPVWSPLRETLDDSLQIELRDKLSENPLWKRLIDSRKMAVGVVQLRDPLHPHFASVNGDEMMYAASLPKIAVLLAANEAIEDGDLPATPELEDDMANMMRFSSNSAASHLIDLVGLKKIADVLRSPKYKLYDPNAGGGIWVGRRYAKKSERNPDPIKNLSHAATVTQVCRFYYLLATGRLVSPARSREMLEMMSDPGIHHKFVSTLDTLAPNAEVYRKSGTWRNWHSDSALVWEPDSKRRYILVGLIEHPQGGTILKELVPVVEAVLQTNSPKAPR